MPFLQKHCVSCHGPTKRKGDLVLHELKPESLAAGLTADLWAGVHERLATGDMPPQGEPRPPAEGLNRVILWVRAELMHAGHGGDLAYPERGNHVPQLTRCKNSVLKVLHKFLGHFHNVIALV